MKTFVLQIFGCFCMLLFFVACCIGKVTGKRFEYYQDPKEFFGR
jgi:hypothetical protein